MKHQFTSVIEKRGRSYVAYIEEIPGVNTQGRTLGEARRYLKEALSMVIEANRELAAKQRSEDACLLRVRAVARRRKTFRLFQSHGPEIGRASCRERERYAG